MNLLDAYTLYFWQLLELRKLSAENVARLFDAYVSETNPSERLKARARWLQARDFVQEWEAEIDATVASISATLGDDMPPFGYLEHEGVRYVAHISAGGVEVNRRAIAAETGPQYKRKNAEPKQHPAYKFSDND